MKVVEVKQNLPTFDQNYVAHGMCGKCHSASHQKLEIDRNFNNLRAGHTNEQFQLLLRKGVYPYKYMDDWEKFEENCLPPIKGFYSKLSLSGISECDYDHAQSIWGEFGMKDLGDYHDLYLKTDVLLLSNIFTAFRMTCLNITPSIWLTSSPIQDWLGKPALRKLRLAYELLTDPDMLLMSEQRT